MNKIYTKRVMLLVSAALLSIPLSAFAVKEDVFTWEQQYVEGGGGEGTPTRSTCYRSCHMNYIWCVTGSLISGLTIFGLIGVGICSLSDTACQDNCDREYADSATGAPAGAGSPGGGPNIMRHQN